jgi:phosphomannomutase
LSKFDINQTLKLIRMTLIKSISGIRGTIGGKVGDNLTPVDAVKFASAYGTWLKNYPLNLNLPLW